MNNKEVYINDRLVDLDEANSPIRLTYAINDLGELKDRQAYSTNSFKLPLTQNNLDICGYPNNPEIIGIQPYRKNTAKIVQGGIEVLVNGVALITNSSDSINVQILSGLKGFFDALGEKKLKELDLSAYDHTWDLETVAASQENTEGYVYSVIDYGGLGIIDRDADARELRPATFRKTIIEQLAIDAGYSINGSYSVYSKYVNSIIAFSNDKFEHGGEFIEDLNTYLTSAKNTLPIFFPSNVLDHVITLNDSAATDAYGQWSGTVFTSARVMKASVKFQYGISQIDIYSGGSAPYTAMFIQKLIGGVWTEIGRNETHQTVSEFVQQDFPNQEINVTVDLLVGDKIRILDRQQPSTDRMYSGIFAGSKLTVTPIAEDVVYGSEVQLAATLPDISQKNFFKDFLQQFGLIVIPDNYTKSLLLINMEDVYSNKQNAYDISDKLFNSVDDVNFALDNYGVRNIAKYKNDPNVDSSLGQGLMILDNQTLENEVTIIESVFAASQSVIKMGGVNVVQIKKIEDPLTSKEFKIKTEPRILINSWLNTSFTFYDNLNSVIVGVISLPTFNGLGYDRLLLENYEEIQRMLYRPYLVTKEILLSEADIANIDWTIPVYDKKTASYYYKNQITYQQGALSTISLIRMP